MIKTIIFDFGGVLVDDLSKEPKLLRAIKKLPATVQKHYWHVQDQSELGKDNYRHCLQVRQQYLFPSQTLKQLERYYLKTKILPPWHLATKLRKNYQVIIFSNNHKGLPQKISKYLHLNLKPFPFINSSSYGLTKPDPRFYQLLLKKFHLNPKECVFVDDKLKNLPPAKKLGIKTFHYKNNEKRLEGFLKNLGISI